MFNLIQCAANTYYLKCYSNAGVYDLGDGTCVLIDTCDHRKSVSDLNKAITEHGWRVRIILNTHCHIDHISGNRFFRATYGCEIYAPPIETFFVKENRIEPSYYYLGVPTNRSRNFFFRDLGTKAKELTEDVLPDGFALLPLPGHCYNMVGIKTPDDVWFLGDAVVDASTFESYRLPLFYDINKSIDTLRMLETLNGALFVPAHTTASEDISALCRLNADALIENKKEILAISDGHIFEDIFAAVCRQFGIVLDMDKYAKLTFTVRIYLQALLEDGTLTATLEDGKLVYHKL